ncbi:MAG: zinc finger domain-containing protein, partial [Tepidimonas sp.]
DAVNKAIEDERAAGRIGPSLQAEVTLTLPPEDHALLATLGEDAKFVFLVSALTLQPGPAQAVQVTPSPHPKCARCWHWRADVGHDPAHPHLCGRCTRNLYGTGEVRTVA